MRPRAAAILCCLGLTIPGSSSAIDDSPFDEVLSRCQKLSASIPEEAKAGQAICQADLESGVSGQLWSKEEADFAEEQIRTIFERPLPTASGMGISYARPAPFAVLSNASQPFDDSALTAPVRGWLASRSRVLSQLQADATLHYGELAVQRAEEIWLAARTPVDLEPARQILKEARTMLPAGAYFALRKRMSPNIAQFRSVVDRSSEVSAGVIDALAIVGSSSPPIFVAPEDSPSEAAVNRFIWAVLRALDYRSLRNPQVLARIEESEIGFFRAVRVADRALDEAVLRNVSADEYRKLWKQARAFREPVLPPPPPSYPAMRGGGPGFFPGGQISPNTPVDYLFLVWEDIRTFVQRTRARASERSVQRFDQRSFLSRERLDYSGAKNIPLPPGIPELPDGYEDWLLWIEAVEKQTPDEVSIRTRLSKSLSALPASVASVIAAKLRAFAARQTEPPPSAIAVIDPKASAVENLIALLRSASTGNGQSEPDPMVDQLIGAWQSVENPAGEMLLNPAAFESFWRGAYARPRARELIESRDRAAREILQKLGVPATLGEPLSAILADGIETACAANRLDVAEKLLSLDTVGSLLLQEARQRFSRDVQLLKSLQTGAEQPEADSIRFEILRTSVSPELARRIAQEIKTRKAEAPKAVPR